MTQGFGRIKRFRKPDIISDIIYNIPQKLVGGAFFYGKIKAGKTTAMMALAQKYRDQHNYKIFDIHGGQRNENMYWTLPSDEINYWDYVKKKFSIKEEQEGPKQYKVKVLYPFFANHIPEKLPNNPPNVKSELFTIPIKSLDVSDFKLIINNMSENANYLWRETSEKLTNKDSGEELIHMLKEAKGENQIFYKNVIKPLVKEKFLQSKNNRFNIDIIKELKDRETVNVLCLKYVPHEFHLFVVGWILRQTKELLDNGKVPKKNIFIFREAGEYFRMKDNSVTEDKIKWFRKLLTDYIRYGRRGMHMFVDTQSVSETKGIVEGSQDLTFIGRTPATSREDRAAMIDALYSVGKITKKQIEKIGDLNSGTFIIIQNNEDAKLKYILLPRTLFWKEKYKNFEKLWEFKVNRWWTTKEDKKELIDDSKKRKEIINERKNYEKMMKINEKKNKKENDNLEIVKIREKPTINKVKDINKNIKSNKLDDDYNEDIEDEIDDFDIDIE